RIQGDVFDHLLAVLPELGLRLYQAPSGADFGRFAGDMRAAALHEAQREQVGNAG
ncbi:MAG: mechanosensitive ion channel family protein, partial [Bordetella sp.]|nr:mechanosensitive ion channel family protein [Bordetella sp.]